MLKFLGFMLMFSMFMIIYLLPMLMFGALCFSFVEYAYRRAGVFLHMAALRRISGCLLVRNQINSLGWTEYVYIKTEKAAETFLDSLAGNSKFPVFVYVLN
ncbi:hypothetical protein CUU66_19475 [Peribacillus deserti]|uniref:Uncharacterized protein n=1 Tax=Peribacillus deserti TaxID=673318 RepID=A0A2N5M294_9BACI|nr:hypothetical protein CUU66_19475 [Peribacillus deserti]